MSITPRQFLCFSCFIAFAILCVPVCELYAQRRGGAGRRSARERSERTVPDGEARPGSSPNPTPPDGETTTGLGTVPDLVGDFSSGQNGESPLQFVENSTLFEGIVPVVPEKVIRYATIVFDEYDTNHDGFLDREEWGVMPGTPQSIDIDGDFIITLEEYLRFIAIYGRARTIHRPAPPVTVRPAVDFSDFVSFRPLSAAPKPKDRRTEDAGSTPADDKVDVNEQKLDENTPLIGERSEAAEDDAQTGESSKSDDSSTEGGENGETEPSRELSDEELDDLSYEVILGGNSSARKYHVPLSEFRGLPSWFVSLDRDGDAQLSLLEFAPSLSAVRLAQFGRLDKNGDGYITIEEMREAMQTQREKAVAP